MAIHAAITLLLVVVQLPRGLDELIRQVTINCAERGLLLTRVRDEVRLTVLSYQKLLESAIAYGIRKAIMVEQQQSQAVIERDEERAKNVELTLKVQWETRGRGGWGRS